MAKRKSPKQSEHDNAVLAVKKIYEEHDKKVWINPGYEKNKTWNNQYIDVIATENENSNKAWVIEIETEDSITNSEAEDQWKNYDKAFTTIWYLAIPENLESEAKELLENHKISNCKLITWVSNNNETFTFSFIPGID